MASAENWKDPLYYTDSRGRRWRVNRGLKEILYSMDRVQRSARYGSERERMKLHQGSRSRGSLSGNTHSGWDAYDRSDYNTHKRSKCGRIHGVFDSHRTRSQGPWIPHGHGITDGGAASDAGQVQIGSYHRNDNGLRGSAEDKGFKMWNNGKRLFPLYVASWKSYGKHGLYVVEVECGGYEYQSAESKRLMTMKKGMEVSISAVTIDPRTKNVWGITDTKGESPGGEVVYMNNLKLVKEVGAFAA